MENILQRWRSFFQKNLIEYLKYYTSQVKLARTMWGRNTWVI
jgi:hypothetical protein